MTRIRIFLLALVVLVAALAIGLHFRRSAPPKVPFTKVKRETIVSTLVTNGKVEPYQWTSVRAERQGMIDRVDVERGQQVAKGALLVELDARDARAQLAAAEARVAGAKAELQTVAQGGKPAEITEIDNEIARLKTSLQIAQRDYESLRRLQQRQAATTQEVVEAREKVEQIQNNIDALQRKRAALVSPADKTAAAARVSEAQAAVQQAQQALDESRIRAPMAGTVYELPARPGVFVNPGDLIASIGNLQRLRVRVYVDEPELGRVRVGLPVNITWDALPGKQWKGTVEQTPTQIVALGTRQVGEVIVSIENPGLELLPGTNINAEIVSQVVQNGLAIPKEAIRRQDGQTGVYLLQGDRVTWRNVTIGASSVTRSQVVSGLNEGDWVALVTDVALKNGQQVEPVYQE